MNDLKLMLNIDFEKAIRLLAEYLPVADERTRKSILFHDIRVGVYLYERGYSRDIVLAGILHDALEFTEITQQILENEFGNKVRQLVAACTKDDLIKDPEEKTTELIKRCIENGQDALIVKAADILDSFKFYTTTNNPEQIQYCMRNAGAIFKFKPDHFTDPVSTELKQWYTQQ